MRLPAIHPVHEFSEKALNADPVLFSRILVATDFSSISRRALQYALCFAHRFGSEICLVHVIPDHLSESAANDHKVAEQQMEEFTRAIPGNSGCCTVVIEHAEGPLSLWVAIERLINRYKITLIVAGTRGVGARSEPFLGSGVEQIFRHATCPVLTIGPATQEGDLPDVPFKNVLYVTDFGPSAGRALGYVVSVAHEFGARVRFLHVVEDMEGSGIPTHEHLRQIHIQRMKHALSASHAAGVQADFCVRFGNVVDEILRISHEIGADLVIMGAKATAGWVGHVPLSTVYNVVARAFCPVLTVRA